MSYGNNPYVLFLILILLVLGMDSESGKKIDVIKKVIERMSATVNNFTAGMHTLASDFQDIHFMMESLHMGVKPD